MKETVGSLGGESLPLNAEEDQEPNTKQQSF